MELPAEIDKMVRCFTADGCSTAHPVIIIFNHLFTGVSKQGGYKTFYSSFNVLIG